MKFEVDVTPDDHGRFHPADSTFTFVIPKRDIPVVELMEYILARIDEYDVEVIS